LDKRSLEKELKTLISSKLRQIRKQSGQTLEEMAYEAELDFSVFYNIYNGIHIPHLTTLFQISNVYGVPIEFWFKTLKSGDKENQDLQRKNNERGLLQAYNKLNDGAKSVVLDMLRSYAKRRKHTIK
jgi:transcriptional regulator with XRE-family HTH domain